MTTVLRRAAPVVGLLVAIGGCNEDGGLPLPVAVDGGVDSAVLADLVTVPDLSPLPAPRIDRVSPASGLTSGGTALDITGAGFQPGLTVLLDGVAAPKNTCIDGTHATATTPPHATGRVRLVLRNPDGQEASARYHYITTRAIETASVPVEMVEPGLTALVTGLLTGDGDVDVATVSAYSSTLTTYDKLGRASGGRSRGNVTTCSFPVAMTVADFDGDRLGDVAVACRQAGGVWIHPGAPKAVNKLSVPSPAVALAAGDLDGDGAVDLAVVDDLHARISVLFNRGQGFFAAGPVLSPGGTPYAVALGDLDGDGKLDIVAADAAKAGSVTTWRGDGKGAFTPVTVFPAPLPSTALHPAPAAGLALGDFDGDKRLDAAVVMGTRYADGSAVMVLRQAALPGTPVVMKGFASASRPTSVMAADLDGDGKLDLAVTDAAANRIELLRGDGAGGFARMNDLASGNDPRQLALADLDLDGHADLLHINFRHGDLVVHQGSAAGFRTPASFGGDGEAGFAVAADFDEDGLDDLLLLAEYDEWVSVRLANGDGGFEDRKLTPLDGASWRLVVGDFNGDRHLDLVVAPDVPMRMGRRLDTLFGKGDGTFAPGPSLTVDFVGAMCAADFNGDGRSDLLARGAIFAGQADGSFGAPALVNAMGWGRIYGVDGALCRDLDGDGDPDLVVWDTRTMTLDVLRNDGKGGFTVGLLPPANTNGLPLLGDVDGDGKVDLVTVGETIHVLLGTGMGSFVDHQSLDNPNPLAAPQLADLDGDGHLDLLLANDSTRQIVVMPGMLGRLGGWRSYGAVPLSAAMVGPVVVGRFDGSGAALMAVPTEGGAVLLPKEVWRLF